MLRPRVLAEDVHVVAVGAVESVAYVPSEQAVFAMLRDEAQNPFCAVVSHRTVAPHAVDAAALALSKGGVRFVSGDLARDERGIVLDVVAIASDTMLVPDLAGPCQAPALASDAHVRPTDPIDAVHARANGVLEELLQVGVANVLARALSDPLAFATALRDVGLASLARRMETLAGVAAQRDRGRAAEAWLDAAVRAALVAEAR